MSVLVNHAIKSAEGPFKSAAVLSSHGASTGYSCKDLACEGIYNQFIPTNQWNRNHSVKNTGFPPKHTSFFPSGPVGVHLVCMRHSQSLSTAADVSFT